jgi:hypothetical protein
VYSCRYEIHYSSFLISHIEIFLSQNREKHRFDGLISGVVLFLQHGRLYEIRDNAKQEEESDKITARSIVGFYLSSRLARFVNYYKRDTVCKKNK